MVIMVLKIIGIVLLVILGIILFILGLLLFLPIQYRFDGKYEDMLNGNARVKWFPLLLKADVSVVDGKPLYVVKLFAGVVMTNTDKKISWIGRRFFSFDDEKPETMSDKTEKNTKKSVGTSNKLNEPTVGIVTVEDDIEFEKPPERKIAEKKILFMIE